jgi:hypothetical protein
LHDHQQPAADGGALVLGQKKQPPARRSVGDSSSPNPTVSVGLTHHPCGWLCRGRSGLAIAAFFCDHRNMDDFEVLADILLGAASIDTFEQGSPGGGADVEPTSPAAERRAVVAERLRATAAVVGFYGHDPLLTTLAGIRRQRHELDAAMRRLLAYGREFTRPRPYRLADLADAAGMSISGVRTAYDNEDIAQVADATGLKPAASGSIPDAQTAAAR